MPSYMTALGFPVTTEQDFRHYVYQASEFGRKIETAHGSYTLWTPGSGIELWVQTNLHRRIIGMNPHFAGEARMQVELTRRVVRHEYTILEGAFYGWANGETSTSEPGKYPLVFDVPDYDVHNELSLPCRRSIQLAAFAHELQGFESKEAYLASQREEARLGVESFIPSGIFTRGGVIKEPPLAQALFSGYVLETEKKMNLITRQKFYWARVHTPGGEIDVVADPQVVQGNIIRNGVIRGSFWLSGRLV
jgi:hypothetical protein